MTRRLVDADEVLRKALAILAVLGVPLCRREAVVRVELPIRSLCKLEAIFDGIFHKAVEAPGQRRWLAPDEVFAKQESLIAEPEHQLVLKCAPFAAVPLGSVVENETAPRLEHSKYFASDFEKGVLVPL